MNSRRTPGDAVLPDGMWLEFAFDQAYLKVLRAGQRQTGQVTPVVGRMLLALDGEMSRAELMAVLNLKDENISAPITKPECQNPDAANGLRTHPTALFYAIAHPQNHQSQPLVAEPWQP
jgi:hypothetical protein